LRRVREVFPSLRRVREVFPSLRRVREVFPSLRRVREVFVTSIICLSKHTPSPSREGRGHTPGPSREGRGHTPGPSQEGSTPSLRRVREVFPSLRRVREVFIISILQQFYPQSQPADLNRIGIDIHTEKAVLNNGLLFMKKRFLHTLAFSVTRNVFERIAILIRNAQLVIHHLNLIPV